MHLFVLVLWVLTHVVLIPCLIGMVRGSRFKGMPFFFAYLVSEELVFAVLLTVSLWAHYGGGSLALYQPIMMVGNVGIGSCLQLAVFFEIVNTLVLPHSSILTTLRPLVRWAAAIAILLAVGISAAVSYTGLRPLTHIFEVLNFSTNLVNLSLLIVLCLFTRTLHISWKSLPAGVALGFGITSSAEIGATSLLSAFGMSGVDSSNIIRMLAFLACTLIWLIYIFLPDARPRFTGQGVQRSEIDAWNEELQKIVE